MSGSYSQDKGKRFERAVAKALRDIWPAARRGLQSRNADDKVSDVIDIGPFRIECKHYKKNGPLRRALQQAIDTSTDGQIPVAISKEDYKEPVALMRYSDWLKLIKILYRQTEIKNDKECE